MRVALTLARRELGAVFGAPTAYVVLAGFLLLGGWFFYNLLAHFSQLLQLYSSVQMGGEEAGLNLNDMVIAPLLHNLAVILVILIPMITMRSFAEERRQATMELLLTSPIGTGTLVLGKFLGLGAFVSLMVALAGIYAVVLAAFGNPEIPVLVAGYVGLWLMALVFVAIGLFASSLTDNQLIAAVTGLVTMLLLFIVAWPAAQAGETMGAVLTHLSITEHFDEMVRGIVSTSGLTYFVTMIAGWLFLTQRSVESLRWR